GGGGEGRLGGEVKEEDGGEVGEGECQEEQQRRDDRGLDHVDAGCVAQQPPQALRKSASHTNMLALAAFVPGAGDYRRCGGGDESVAAASRGGIAQDC